MYGPSKADFREHSNVKQCSENNEGGQNEGTSAQNATSEVNKNGRQLAALTNIEQRGLEIEQCVKQLGKYCVQLHTFFLYSLKSVDCYSNLKGY